MNKLSCEICMDLIPLVRDGAASEESREAVEAHIAECPDCRAFYRQGPPAISDGEQVFDRFRRKTRSLFVMLLMFGLFFGMSLINGSGLFYNAVLMPLTGAVGYFIFRGKAFFITPLLIFGTHGLLSVGRFLLHMEAEPLPSVLMWSFVFSLLALVGVLIAGLLHFAFRKEN